MSGTKVWNRAFDPELRVIYALSRRSERMAAVNDLAERSGAPRSMIYSQASRLGIQHKDCRKPWTPEEVEQLIQMAGRVSVKRMCERLKRTPRSVEQKLWAEKISWRGNSKGYSRGELARLMGVGGTRIRHYLISRRLKANSWGNVYEDDLLNFMAVNLESLELRSMNQEWLKQCLRKLVGHLSNAQELAS